MSAQPPPEFVVPNLTASQLEGMSPDEIIEAFGGEEAALRFERYQRFMHVAPAKAKGDIIRIVQYVMRDTEDYYNPDRSRYQVAVHHRLIADALTEVLRGKCLRLAISMPPQHGKSQLGKTFLSTHVGEYPWKHLLFGTYNQEFAKENGDDVRAMMNTEEFRRIYPSPDAVLRTGSKAKDHMVTSVGGKLSFLGRGGSGTGRPADGFLVDDFFKDPQEANSRATRDAAWRWVTQVANARLHNLSWMVIICTRWSDDDPIARLTDPSNPHYNKEVSDKWTVINVPAILDDEKLARALGKQVGEALWPERFGLELLNTARRMDPVGFSALYMGKPTPPEGVFYKQFDIQEYDSLEAFPRVARMYLTGDLAVSPERTADRSAVGIWGLDEHDNLWLHPDLYWDRRASDESVDTIIEKGKQYRIMEAFFEKGQMDRAIGPFMEKRMAEEGAYFTLSKLSVVGDKGTRSLSTRGRMRQRKVFFPNFAPWWPAAKEEMLKFTGSGEDKSDDFCDMIALIGQALGDTVVATNDASNNVLKFPKPGTFGWTINEHRRQQARDKRREAMRGM